MRGLEGPAVLPAGQGKPKIVFLTTAETTIKELAQLLRRKMPTFTIEVHTSLPRHPKIDDTAQVVLVYSAVGTDLSVYLTACRRWFPNASLGLLVGAWPPSTCLPLLRSGLIKGVVPLNLGLEVQIAVLGILLAGGEYCPPALVMQAPQESAIRVGEHEGLPDYAGHGLTPREAQIMALVAQGLQNKLIAAHMALSEHTVKAHVRNLFTKLRVSNRTQAVAKCRDWIGDSRPGALNGQNSADGAEMQLSFR
jgi:DNA-binding NarL/FixJ family response regulator